eukprot:6175130-Pleurochrysis_carterae.AAC.2
MQLSELAAAPILRCSLEEKVKHQSRRFRGRGACAVTQQIAETWRFRARAGLHPRCKRATRLR